MPTCTVSTRPMPHDDWRTQQTDEARQQTLARFCNMMKINGRYDGNPSHGESYIEQLYENNFLTDKGRAAWAIETYSRNNFGLVYNYFCPDDQVVSMMPIQGMGWRGIPDNIARFMGKNVRQRVFCKDESVGGKTGYRYIAKDIRKLNRNRVPMPEPKIKDPEIPGQDVSYFL
ncbi:T6SS effector phospholipase Tle3 domain-containing protein [Huaxiibacter chinensis]